MNRKQLYWLNVFYMLVGFTFIAIAIYNFSRFSEDLTSFLKFLTH